jgi:N-acetylneuraminic acid mutarotase
MRWTQIQPHEEPKDTPLEGRRPGGRDIWGNSFVHGGHFYVFGGAWNRFPPGDRPELDRLGVANDLWRFDPAEGEWQLLEPDDGGLDYSHRAARPGGRLLACTWAVGDNVYLFGGLTILEHGQFGRALNDLWRYHAPSGRWEQVHPDTGWCNFVNRPSHPPIRIAAGAAAIGERLYVFGGTPYTAPTFTVNDLWCYDAGPGCWEQLSPYHLPRQGAGYDSQAIYPGPRYCANLFAHGEMLYLFSGRDLDKSGERDVVLGGTGPEWFNDLWRYDPATNAWTLLHPDEPLGGYGAGTTYPAPRYGSGHAVDGDDFYLFGGYCSLNAGKDRNDFWRYHVPTDRWALLHPDDGAADYGRGAPYPPVRRVPAMEAIGQSLYLFGGLNYFIGPAIRGYWAHPGGARRRAFPFPLNDLWRCDLGE